MKKLSIVVLISIVLVSVFSVFNVRFLRMLDGKMAFSLFQTVEKEVKGGEWEGLDDQKYLIEESAPYPLSNFVFLGQCYSDTNIVGWLDDSILFDSTSDDSLVSLYRYYPALGKKEEMIGDKKFLQLKHIASKDKKKVLINSKIQNCSALIIYQFMEDKFLKGDYEYDALCGYNNSLFEIYDSSTKKSEELFKYTIKSKIEENNPNSMTFNFGDFSTSNNFNYLAYYFKDYENYYLVKCDINTKKTKSFKMLLDKTIKGLDDLDQIAVSNDGNVAWIIKKGDLYKMNLNKQELDLEYVISNVAGYGISSDERYIVYFKSQETQKGSVELKCFDLLSKNNYRLEENIIKESHILSSSGTKVAYLVEESNCVKLYAKDFSDEKSERRLVHTFYDFSRLDCIDLSSDGKSLFISYHTNEKNKKSDKYKMCLIKL